MRIALDVDGVILNWYYNALNLLELFEERLLYPDDWNVPEILDNWDIISHNKCFWKNLQPLSNPRKWDIKPDLYLTAMPEHWYDLRNSNLRLIGCPKAPLVISQNKLQYCLENDIDLLIDDRPETVKEFVDAGHSDKIMQFMTYYAQWPLVKGVRGLYGL